MTKTRSRTIDSKTQQFIVVLNITQGGRFKELEQLQELLHLVESNGYEVSYVAMASVKTPSVKTYIHEGYLKHLKDVCAELKPKIIVCNLALQARYHRNLEKALCVDFMDRTELLLSLFEKRATSTAGMLQVELARLSYMQTKLVRGWTHLERQRGGIGLRGGPGETQIEVDRRLLRERIHKTKTKLDRVVKTRQLNRNKRQSERVPTVALVGYTNAGKSSLFNQLTQANTWANDQLFATLDPLVRHVHIPECHQPLLLIDTVGFMRDLPDPLVTAFRSTLEEMIYCDLILHVVDCSDPEMAEKTASVESTLVAIDADDVPRQMVFNKADLQPSFASRKPGSCVVSSLNKRGVQPLVEQLRSWLTAQNQT